MDEANGKIIEISMSDMKAASNPHTLCSSGIGSCVVITLYDSQKRIGAMAHPMLTDSPASEAGNISGSMENPLRFVNSAIDAMISALEKWEHLGSGLKQKL